jgi:hypothetical protein
VAPALGQHARPHGVLRRQEIQHVLEPGGRRPGER